MKALTIFLLFTTISFSQIEYDKVQHFVAGSVISTTTYWVTRDITKDKSTAFWVGLGSGTLAGITNELFDVSQGYRFDWADLGYTIAGSLTVTFIFNLL